MADYQPLIQRAIAGLDRNTGEARRALYERARTALVAQLRGVDPPLQEAEITRERLALEEAIRKVEAEAARRVRIDPPAGASAPPGASAPRFPNAATPQQPPSAPRFPNAAGPAPNRPAPRPPLPPGAPKPPLPGIPPAAAKPPAAPPKLPPSPQRTPPPAAGKPKPGIPGAPPLGAPPLGAPPPPGAPRPARDPFAELPNTHDFDRLMEPRLAQEDFNRAEAPTTHPTDPFREPPPPRGRPPRDAREAQQEDEEDERPRRGIGGIVKAAIAVVLVLAIGWFAWSQRGLVTDMLQSFRGSSTQQATKDSKSGQPTTGRPKISDRLGSQDTQSGPAVAQRVVLYEEEPNDPQGKRYVGSAIWRTETVSPGPGRPPELAIRADVEIPERRLTMSFSIRRNTDQTLPASHTMEVTFNLPADFPAGGISNVPGVLMKQAEQTRGTPLAGLAVKVTNNFFLIGLSAVESDQARNIQLLKERAWFDIPIVYNNNRRAILAIEKGTPGERAFAEAFAAWKQ
jgi:hypothetical protein